MFWFAFFWRTGNIDMQEENLKLKDENLKLEEEIKNLRGIINLMNESLPKYIDEFYFRNESKLKCWNNIR